MQHVENPVQDCPLPRWQIIKQSLNNVSPHELKTFLENHPDCRIMDVRTRKEYETDHLSGAQLMDYLGENFLDELESLDKNNIYLIYCRSGRRSLRVCRLMQNADFPQVYNLDGGLTAILD